MLVLTRPAGALPIGGMTDELQLQVYVPGPMLASARAANHTSLRDRQSW